MNLSDTHCGACAAGYPCPEMQVAEVGRTMHMPEPRPTPRPFYGEDAPFIHPTAVVDPGVRLGRGTKVWAHAVICTGAVLGEQCAVGPSSFIGVNAKLGDHVRIQHAAHLTDHITIGSRVFIGNGVMTGNDAHPVVNNPHFKREPPTIKGEASIGMNATILPGVVIGEGAVVGAGAVVTKSVPAYTCVVGNPARIMARAEKTARG